MNQSQCENKNKDKKVIEFKYSDLGEGITEGVILSWNVKEGQHVKDQDILLEVENDKLTAEIRSDVSGVVKKIFYNEGDNIKVGDTLLLLELE